MKAADIADADVLAAIDRLGRNRFETFHHLNAAAVEFWRGSPHHGRMPVMNFELQTEFPDVPAKVLLAKLRKLLKRGLVTGCGCGCGGDWELSSFGGCA